MMTLGWVLAVVFAFVAGFTLGGKASAQELSETFGKALTDSSNEALLYLTRLGVARRLHLLDLAQAQAKVASVALCAVVERREVADEVVLWLGERMQRVPGDMDAEHPDSAALKDATAELVAPVPRG